MELKVTLWHLYPHTLIMQVPNVPYGVESGVYDYQLFIKRVFLFLMYRMELKARLLMDKGVLGVVLVPNVPYGVESPSPSLPSHRHCKFLMYRMELKVMGKTKPKLI